MLLLSIILISNFKACSRKDIIFCFRKYLFDHPREDPNYNPLPEDERPGGFNWGEGAAAGGVNEENNQNPQEG